MNRTVISAIGAFAISCSTLTAQIPQLINYQGRVVVGTTNFDGNGSFKFALVNSAGTTAYWTNDGTHLDGSEPTASVAITVSKGLYSVLLGDASLTNMTAVPASVFNNGDVRLRVWFDDGTHGSQLLTPDQRIASVGYAVIAGNVPDGAITGAKIAPSTIASSNIANGAITNLQIDSTTVQQRITGSAPAGQFIQSINADGTVVATAPLEVVLPNNNTAKGDQALANNTTGTNNTAIGFKALFSNTTGVLNTAVGSGALSSNTTSDNNTANGFDSLQQNTTGTQNTAYGVNSLVNNTSGNFNTADGYNSLLSNTTGTGNVAAGRHALFSNTIGNSNIGLGDSAGSNLTTGNNNIDIGNAGVAAEANIIRIGTAQTDTFLTGIIHGNGSGLTTVSAGSLTGFVPGASLNSVPAASLTGAVPSSVLTSVPGANLTGSVPSAALTSVPAGNLTGSVADARLSSNVALLNGSNTFTATNNFTGGNVGIGPTTSSSAGVITQNGIRLMHSFGSANFFAGSGAGNFTMTGNANTATGVGALNSNTTGDYNTAGGYFSLSSNTTGTYNTANGFGSLNSNTTGASNTASGGYAVYSSTTGFGNTGSGYFALFSNTTGSNNTAVGQSALRYTTGSGNIAIGNSSGSDLTTGNNNIDIGNAGVAAETNIIRIGTAQTDTFLTGMIHGNGAGLTNLSVPQDELVAVTHNGTGSVNVAVPRFLTILSDIGTAMTYTDSPTDGATVTINTTGIYALRYTIKQRWDFIPSCEVALLKNVGTDPGMTSLDQLAYDHRYEIYSTAYPTVHATVYLQSGDVVRPWGSAPQNNESRFEIWRVR